MKRRSSVAGIVLGLVVCLFIGALAIGGCAIGGYNKSVRLKTDVDTKWAQVETVLQRRYDLIPNLVETVKGYAKHEDQIFTDIAKSRAAYFSAGPQSEKVEAANGVERALSRLLVLRETYPELKAQTSFLTLQDELAGTENRIAVERKRYNDAVGELNGYVRSFFGRMFAGWAGVSEAKFFEAPKEAQVAPKVDFGTGAKP